MVDSKKKKLYLELISYGRIQRWTLMLTARFLHLFKSSLSSVLAKSDENVQFKLDQHVICIENRC